MLLSIVTPVSNRPTIGPASAPEAIKNHKAGPAIHLRSIFHEMFMLMIRQCDHGRPVRPAIATQRVVRSDTPANTRIIPSKILQR